MSIFFAKKTLKCVVNISSMGCIRIIFLCLNIFGRKWTFSLDICLIEYKSSTEIICKNNKYLKNRCNVKLKFLSGMKTSDKKDPIFQFLRNI